MPKQPFYYDSLDPRAPGTKKSDGVLHDGLLKRLVNSEHIRGTDEIKNSSIGPSSIDLTLGDQVYVVSTSSTPFPGQSVRSMLDGSKVETLHIHDKGALLQRGKLYVAELNEDLDLSSPFNCGDGVLDGLTGRTTPKSSIGRLDVLSRVILDGEPTYDRVPRNYKGKLYLEICPASFDIKVKRGDSLTQLRLFSCNSVDDLTLHGRELQEYAESNPCLLNEKGKNAFASKHFTEDGLFLGVDLRDDVIVFQADDPGQPIDISATDRYDPKNFWIPRSPTGKKFRAKKSEFYLMQSSEHLVVPDDYAVEIVATDETLVDARIHYAGFAHPGFGYTSDGKPEGRPIVFEVRALHVPVSLWDGKIFAKIHFHKMYQPPEKSYNLTGSYNNQTSRNILSKVFTPWCP